MVEAEWAETAFDLASLALSLHDFSRDRSFWNGFWVVADGLSVIIPGVPALSLFKRGAAATREFIQQSPKLHRALTTGVMSYGRLSNVKIGDDFRRHHIIEKRFADRLQTTEWKMPAIVLHQDDHLLITNKIRQKIPYGRQNWDRLSRAEIISHHIAAYDDLYRETGDHLWKFLQEFAEAHLHSIR